MGSNHKEKIILILEIIGMTFLFAMLDTAGIVKYIVASTLTILLFAVFYKRKSIFFDIWYLLIPVAVYCLIGLGLNIIHYNFNEWTFKTLGFWILPPMFSYVLCMAYENRQEHLVDIEFYGCILAYIYTGFEGVFTLKPYESTFAFVFGLFILYYVYRRKWIHVGLATIFMFYAHKRIAVLAVAACLIVMLVMKFLKNDKKWVLLGWSGVMIAIGVYLYSIFSGVFEIICKKFKINTSTRLGVFKQIAEVLPDNYLLGDGIGSGNHLLSQILKPEKYERWFQNPHNDFLKTYVELGAIGIILFLVSYFVVLMIAGKRIEKKTLVQLLTIILYFMLLMTTDNVSIYILFLVPMYTIYYTLIREKI